MGMHRQPISFNVFPAKLILVASMIYLNLMAPLAVAFGLIAPEEITIYYNFSAMEQSVFIYILVLNIIFTGTFSILLLFSRNKIKVYRCGTWGGLIVCLALVAFLYGDAWTLERSEIKSRASLFSAVGISAALAYLSATVAGNESGWKRAAACLILLSASFLSFERETLLYFFIPLACYLSRNKINWWLLAFLFSAAVLVLGSYKSSLILMKSNESWVINDAVTMVADATVRSLVSDNIHKLGIETSLLVGSAPEYHRHTMIFPFQIERIVFGSATTNGQLATLFYTNGDVGTGFSGLAEVQITFGALGPLILLLLLFVLFRGALNTSSIIIIIATTIGMIKFQRSEFWPSTIGYVAGPMILEFLSRVSRRLRFSRHSGPAQEPTTRHTGCSDREAE